MACRTCGTVKEPVPASSALSFSTSANQVRGINGQLYSVKKSLVPSHQRPSGGWAATFEIQGQRINFTGPSARSSFVEARRLLKLNGVAIHDRDLWLNLNLQWLERVPKKFHLVSISALMELAAPNVPAPDSPTANRARIHVSEWESKGWGMLQMYLAQDVYEYGTFLTLVTEFRKWLDPAVNPTLGDPEVFRGITVSLAALRANPQYTQQGAREWLVDTLNEWRVRRGEEPTSFDEESLAYHWT